MFLSTHTLLNHLIRLLLRVSTDTDIMQMYLKPNYNFFYFSIKNYTYLKLFSW